MAITNKNTPAKKAKSLVENAADVLANSIARTRPGEDKFGLGKTLLPGGPQIIDLGAARVKSDTPFPDFTAGAPRATPPGATPPVGAEPMPSLDKTRFKSPQETEGGGDPHAAETGPDSDYTKIMDRDEEGYDDTVVPGKGNVLPKWARKNESVDPDELNSYIDFDEVKEDLGDELNERLDTFVRAGERGRPKSYKIVRTHTTEKPVEPGSRSKMNVNHYDVVHKTSGEKIGSFKHEAGAPKAELETKLHNIIKKHHGMPTKGRPRTTSEALENIVQDILTEKQPELTEDIDAMFNGENLSEDLKTKITTIFEAAVSTRVKSVTEEIEKIAVSQLEEAVEEIKSELTDQVDEYLNYIVEEWIKENEIAIEKGLKAEIVEDFIAGLRNLFLENYIDIPEEKEDVLEGLTQKVAELEESLDNEITRNIELKKNLKEQDKISIISDVTDGLSEAQTEKMVALAESVNYTTPTEFKTKLETLKENYFATTHVRVPTLDSLNEDAAVFDEETTDATPVADPLISNYVKALAKIARN